MANVLETIQKLLQDVIAPDVRETKVRLEALDRRMDERFKSLTEIFETKFASMQVQNDANYKIMQLTLGEIRAKAEAIGLQGTLDLRERVAVIEHELSLRKAS